MDNLETIAFASLEEVLPEEVQTQAVYALESGKVLYFPQLPFVLKDQENSFLSPAIADPRSKNISYDLHTDRLRGTTCQEEEFTLLKNMIHRYAIFSRELIGRIVPGYLPHIQQARTSFRPVEAKGRASSCRQDDTRLHIDAFPANPVKGRRILRVFTNMNPEGKARVWRLGEPFDQVASVFLPRFSQPLPGMPYLLRALKITKSLRSPYDHYMLKLHDAMKGDGNYQQIAKQQEVHFPPGSTWIVYTDQVSHAAMAGQHLLEQTFYLPSQALHHAEISPLKVLERLLQRPLV
jgi:hypothetical protein